MTEKLALHILNAGMVLDRSVFMGLSADNIGLNIEAIRSHVGKSLTVVERADKFFTSDNLLALIKANDPDYRLIAEKADVTITDSTVMAILTAESAKASIIAAMIPPVPPYEFAKIPTGWVLSSNIQITKTRVKRLVTNDMGDNTHYGISITQLKRIWDVASVYWATGKGRDYLHDVRAEGYSKTATMYGTYVTVGCQAFRRYELEQLALHFGWDFPDQKAA